METENTDKLTDEYKAIKPSQRIAAIIGLIVILGLIVWLIIALINKSSPETYLIIFASIIFVSITAYAFIAVKRLTK